MKDFCNCQDWKDLKESSPSIFVKDDEYGWVISWIELTDDVAYKQIHRYGISIKYCPLCGEKLVE